ncbi:hypothetical protein CY35_03G017600 [Sphagnum magellanicum]|nr:hypothetical protein CY35_03G017600 [Sphagnum magellanicum]
MCWGSSINTRKHPSSTRYPSLYIRFLVGPFGDLRGRRPVVAKMSQRCLFPTMLSQDNFQGKCALLTQGLCQS